MKPVNQNAAATSGRSFPKTGKKLPDAPNGGGTATTRPWQPWERNYSGNRVGVRADGDWTILHILSGGAETTTSIREHEAWDLAMRVSPKLAATFQEVCAENRKMRDALFKLGPQCRQANIEELREAAEEVDCGDGCPNHFYDGSCNAHECHRENTDGGCSWLRAESLRDLATALETQAEIKPTEGWRTMADCPSDGRPVWVIGGHFAEPTLRAADGSYWRSATAAGLGRPTHWHPEMKPLAPAYALDIAGAA